MKEPHVTYRSECSNCSKRLKMDGGWRPASTGYEERNAECGDCGAKYLVRRRRKRSAISEVIIGALSLIPEAIGALRNPWRVGAATVIGVCSLAIFFLPAPRGNHTADAQQGADGARSSSSSQETLDPTVNAAESESRALIGQKAATNGKSSAGWAVNSFWSKFTKCRLALVYLLGSVAFVAAGGLSKTTVKSAPTTRTIGQSGGNPFGSVEP